MFHSLHVLQQSLHFLFQTAKRTASMSAEKAPVSSSSIMCGSLNV